MAIVVEPKFSKSDYVTNRKAGDLAIINGISKKGYYQFEAYYSSMFDELKDLDRFPYELQVNYQEFWDFCDEKEKAKLDKIIEKKKA